MTLVKKLREVFVDEPVLEKNSFSLLRSITICLEYVLEVDCKNNQLQEISQQPGDFTVTGNFSFSPKWRTGLG
jgi:hypothetical protein